LVVESSESLSYKLDVCELAAGAALAGVLPFACCGIGMAILLGGTCRCTGSIAALP
jgi:hypothetical protein